MCHMINSTEQFFFLALYIEAPEESSNFETVYVLNLNYR